MSLYTLPKAFLTLYEAEFISDHRSAGQIPMAQFQFVFVRVAFGQLLGLGVDAEPVTDIRPDSGRMLLQRVSATRQKPTCQPHPDIFVRTE